MSLIPTLVAQSKQWPNVRMAPMLAALALKLKSNATRAVLTVARIAHERPWCQDLIETVLQELEYMVLQNGQCALLQDLSGRASAELLWSACGSAQLFEQQTAVRLLLLAGRQSPHLYQQTIATLLTQRYTSGGGGGGGDEDAASGAGLGALIRLLSVPLGTTDALHIQPAIELALDGVLLRAERSGRDDRRCDANVLANLLMVVRLERQQRSCSVVCLERKDVGRTLVSAVAKLLQIWAVYLQREMRHVEAQVLAPEATDGGDNVDGVVDAKRAKWDAVDVMLVDDESQHVEETQYDEDGDDYGDGKLVAGRCAEQIHTLASLLDTLELGGPETKMSEWEDGCLFPRWDKE